MRSRPIQINPSSPSRGGSNMNINIDGETPSLYSSNHNLNHSLNMNTLPSSFSTLPLRNNIDIDDIPELHRHHINGRRGLAGLSINDNDSDNDNDNDITHNAEDMNVQNYSLPVGSLPSSIRERRSQVANGNHEFFSNSSSQRRSSGTFRSLGHFQQRDRQLDQQQEQEQRLHHIHQNQHQHQHRHYANTYGERMARSMPIPGAPFLTSQRDNASTERLSSIPSMTLPDSASDINDSGSVPYGSLKKYGSYSESQFRSPLGSPHQQRVRFESGKNPRADANANANVAGRISHSYQSPFNIQQKVEESRRNGTLIKNQTKSSMAALLSNTDNGITITSSNTNTNTYTHTPNENETLQANGYGHGHGNMHGGIGSLINNTKNEVDEGAIHHESSIPIPSSINIGSTTTTQSFLSMTMTDQSQKSITDNNMQRNDLHNRIKSSPSSTAVNEYDEKVTVRESSLSGSLTGLSVLQTTPRGNTIFNSETKGSMLNIQARSRSFSDDRIGLKPPFSMDFHCDSNVSENCENSVGGAANGYDPFMNGAFDFDMDG